MNISEIKKLLVKYIDHVSGIEGTDFIPKNIGHSNSYGRITTSSPFTRVELDVLWECAGWDEKEKVWR